MTMQTNLSLGVAAALLMIAVPVAAHHAFAAEFDSTKPVKLTGKIIKVDWINPHAWIHIEVVNENGEKESWACEGGTPNTLFRRGFNKKSLLPGTEIIVDGYQAKDGSNKMNGRDLTFLDGRKLFMGSSGTGAPKDGTDPTNRR